MSTAQNLGRFLSNVNPFQALPAKDLARLAALATEKTFAKGEMIYNEGDPADSVWILKDGQIEIFKYTSEGRPLVIEMLGPKELFGALCRLGGSAKTYPCTAISATPCAVVRILDRAFLDFYNRYPAMVMGVCSLCSQRLYAIQGLSCQGQEHVDKRIAGALLQLRKANGNILRFTKREVAELAGTTVETTIRTVSLFSKKGWVSSSRGQILLKAPAELEKLLTSC